MNAEERKAKLEEYGRGYAILEAALADIPPRSMELQSLAAGLVGARSDRAHGR